MKNLIKTLIFMSFVILIFFGCAKKPEKVRIGYLDVTNSLPLYVAVENHLFNDRNINVELIKFQTSNDLVEALIAGRIDLEVSASTSFLFAMELRSSGEFKIFSVNLQTKEKYPDNIIVREGSSISSVKDLAGKTLGTFPGSTFMVITKLILRYFLDPDQVSIEQIPPTVQVEALASGKVDAIYTMEPFSTLAIEKANGRILEAAPAEKYILDPLPGGAAAFSSAFLKNNPQTAKKIINSFNDAIDFIRTNEPAAKEYLTKFTLLSTDLVKKITIVEFWKLNEIDLAPLQKYSDILTNEGDLKEKVNVNEMIYKIK